MSVIKLGQIDIYRHLNVAVTLMLSSFLTIISYYQETFICVLNQDDLGLVVRSRSIKPLVANVCRVSTKISS